MKSYYYVLIFAFLLFGYSCNNQTNKPVAKNGIIDLSELIIDNNTAIKLDGEWLFFWDTLIPPDEAFHQKKDTFMYIPGLWTDFTVKNKKLPSFGKATFALKVILPKTDKILAIRKSRVISASKLWINNKLIYEQGTVNKTKNNFVADDIPKTYFLNLKTDTLHLVMHIANYLHVKAGIHNSITLGTASKVEESDLKKMGFDLFLLGVFFIIGLYEITLFLYRRNEKSALWFGLVCIFSSFLLVTEGEFLILRLFPDMPQWLAYKTFFVANYLRVPLFVLFLIPIFSEEISQRFKKLMIISGLSLSVFTIVTPTYIFSQSLIVFFILTMIVFIYLIFKLSIAVLRKRKGALLSFIGFLILFSATIHDILADKMIIHSTSLVPIGFTVFIVIHTIMLSYRFTKAFNRTQELALELQDINENLEDLVEQRTAHIEQQKEEIISQSENLKEANEEITNQNKQLDKKNQEITNSITYAQRIQMAILPSREYINSMFKHNFILYMPRDIVSGDFYWARKIGRFNVFVAADCTGHGVPGAFMSMLSISLLNELVTTTKFDDPGIILDKLRSKIKTSLQQTGKVGEQKDGLDIAFCTYDTENNIIKYAGAYNPCYIVRKINYSIDVNQIRADRQPIGVYEKERDFTTHKIQLQKNDMVYLTSDGYLDQFGGDKGDKFKTKRFKELLSLIYEKNMQEQYQILHQSIINWMSNKYIQLDDILVVGFRI